ncbi:uncharacterized protein LOC115188807 isoform X3 [Salmo trutta]|nr:uncharacterized protein LOC115188807 isoform X3 [Salmo trutta]
MCDLGFSRSPHQCRLRVKTLKANYVRAKLLRSVDDSQPCSFRYYSEMDAVLGRNRAMEGTGGGRHFGSPEGIGGLLGGCHFGSELIAETGRYLGSEGIGGLRGGRNFVSPEGTAGRQPRYMVSEMKVEEEDREADDTDDYEFNGGGITTRSLVGPGGRRHDAFLEHSNDYHEPAVHPLEDDHSSRSTPPPPPQPASPFSPPPDHSPNLGSGTTVPSTQPLEPVLKHLADCFQRLVSESRGLMVQLEGQRQEQVRDRYARWQQDLLSQWLEREEMRQRETTDREDRREKARMAHEIRVLTLLSSLAQNQQRPKQTPHHSCSCCHQCSRVEAVGGATSGPSTITRRDDGTEDRDWMESEAL